MSVSEPAEVFFRTGSNDVPIHPSRLGAREGISEPIALSVTSDMDGIADAWRAFEAVADCTVFQTYAWQSAWLKHIGVRKGVVPVIVAGRGAGGSLLFLMPLAVEARGRVKQLTWLGNDLCDYNGPLLAPDFSERVDVDGFAALWGQIRQFLRQRGFHFDAVVLKKMPERLDAQANPFAALAVTLNPSGAWRVRLPATFDAFYEARRSPGMRKRDRKKQKRLAEFGEIRFRRVTETSGIVAVLDTLFAQKAHYLAAIGAPDIFSNPGQVDFYREVMTRPDAAAQICRLDIGPVTAAVSCGFVFHGTYCHVLTSFTEGPVGKFGPGALHLRRLFEHAIAEGCRTFDFTIGDEPYKREWCDEPLKVYDFFAAETPLGFAAVLPSLVKAQVKRVIKQTPILWSLAKTIRVGVRRIRGEGVAPGRRCDPDSEEDAA